MKFSFLLYMLNRKLKGAAKKSAEFRNRLAEKNFTLQIRTEDSKRARFFTFNNGEVESKGSTIDNAQISLIWSDADTGFKTMTAKDGNASMKALQDGKLKLDGDAQLALWFTETIKQMMKA